MTAELVVAQRGSDLDSLTPAAREAVVVGYLTDARERLALALTATGIEGVAAVRTEIGFIADATKRLGLSKEIQLDAQEMVRRAEYTLGKAIRQGQADDTIRRRGQTANPSNQYGRADVHLVEKSGPEDYADRSELSGNGREPNGIYHLADGVTEDQFDRAVTTAKSTGNLSRANVIREVKGQNEAARLTRQQRADQIADLAEQGYSSRQMPSRVGVTEESVRQIARDFDITIPADKIIGGTRRLNHTYMVESTVTGLDNLVSALNLIDFAEVDPAEAAEWATSLTESIAALKRFQNRIKEIAHV